ncbi:hypothetical protein ACF0H5_015053 [Mactra antiquata]
MPESIALDFVNHGAIPKASRNWAEDFRPEAKKLRKLLRLYFYPAFRWRENVCSFHLVYFMLLLVQIVKVSLVTTQYFNIQHDAIGYYTRIPSDNMTVKIKYFSIPENGSHSNTADLVIHGNEFTLDAGLTTSMSDNKIHYRYDVMKHLEHLNASDRLQSMLSTTLDFTIHSVRVLEKIQRARCLHVQGWITFSDLDNNGQVILNLETLTHRIPCKNMGLNITDWSLENTNQATTSAVMAFSVISLLLTLSSIFFMCFVYWKTKSFMRKYYQVYYQTTDDDETDLPTLEYFRFLKLWDLFVLTADILSLVGTSWIIKNAEFSTPALAGETLLSVVNGDEIFTTLAMLEDGKTGGVWVWWFFRLYLMTYIAIFTIIAINLLIAIYMSAYESIKEYYATKPEERSLGPLEKAIRQYVQDSESQNGVRNSIYELLSDKGSKSDGEISLRRELRKLIKLNAAKQDIVVLKARTLYNFMEDKDVDDEDKSSSINLGAIKFSFLSLNLRN